MSTKTDARKLHGATQAHLRRLVVKAVRGGMTQTDAAGAYRVSLRAVSKWMALDEAGELQALKPKRRAYERNDAAIARRLAEDYPALAREAKREKATVYWGDEMGLRSGHVTEISYAPLGQTPVGCASGQRFGCNMISAITNRGALAFMVFQGIFQNPLFIEFMERMLKQAKGKLYLIVDGHPVHKSAAAKRFVAANAERLRLILLPGYCPELNPDELPNQDVKTNALGKSRPTNKAEMIASVRSHLCRRQTQPHLIRNLFHEEHAHYGA